MKFGLSSPRLYWHDKKPVPSVSTITKIFRNGIPFEWPATKAMEYILSCGLDPNFDFEDVCNEAIGECQRYINECLGLGTAVHNSIENYFLTGSKEPAPLPPQIEDDIMYEIMLERAWKFLETFNVEPILVEKAMSNDRYAGTIDFFGELDSEAFESKRWCTANNEEFPRPHRRVKALLDWKVTAGYYDDMPVKLAAYNRLLREYGYKPDAMLIGRFSKDTGSLNIKDYTPEEEHSLVTFDMACDIFHHVFGDYLKETEQEAERQRIAKIERKKK